MARLEGRALSRRFGHRVAVRGVSLAVESGEIVALLGPNGAGKTVTFEMLAGISRPTGGAVLYDGTDITQAPMFRRARLGIGYLCQQHSVFRHLTVVENVTSVLEARGARRAAALRTAHEVLGRLGLTVLRDRRAATLSGGEKRRVELARSLALSPSILLLDEPFTGVDPRTIEDLHAHLTDLPNQGIGVLITDHNVIETLRLCDRGYVLAEGRLLAAGTSQQLIDNDEVRAQYLGEWFAPAETGTSR